jgi:hypothetical protein
MAPKIQLAWAIWNDRSGIFYGTVTDTRVCAILEQIETQELTWEDCRRRGDRAVKIRIEVVG